LPKKDTFNLNSLHYNWHIDPKTKINFPSPSPKPQHFFNYVLSEDTENKPKAIMIKNNCENKSLIPQKSLANIQIAKF